MALNDDILEAQIRHSMYLQRHSSSVTKRALALLLKSEKRILAQLEKVTMTKLGEARQRLLLKRIKKIIDNTYQPMLTGLRAESKELAIYEAGFQVTMLKNAIPVAVDLVTPSPQQLSAAVKARPFNGRHLKTWYSALPKAQFARVKDEIAMGFAEGRTTEDVVRSLRGTRRHKYTDGIFQRGRRGTQTAVRTAMNHTANVAKSETFAANSDIIREIQWVSTLDSSTTVQCAARDGQLFPLDKGPRPPGHPGCRSTMSAIIKSWKEMGINLQQAPTSTRASMDGQIPAKTTYDGFLRKQNIGFQDEFLGKRKAQLFRKGKLPLKKFIDRRGNELTLEQLRVAQPDAWKAAKL